jgi:hypothetical protein
LQDHDQSRKRRFRGGVVKLLVERSVVLCGHGGQVRNQSSQQLVTSQGSLLLVADDPVGRTVVACPNYGTNVKVCTSTVNVQTGYSSLVSIDGHAVCLDTLTGQTDGLDAGAVLYHVSKAVQTLVDVAS